MKKRFLCMTLVLSMIMSLFPTVAFGQEINDTEDSTSTDLSTDSNDTYLTEGLFSGTSPLLTINFSDGDQYQHLLVEEYSQVVYATVDADGVITDVGATADNYNIKFEENDVDGYTLTLKDATISLDIDSNSDAYYIISSDASLTIILEGTNQLTSTHNGIYSAKDITISGDGTLTIHSNSSGIWGGADLTITSGTVAIFATYMVVVAYNVTISGTANVAISGSDTGLCAENQITIQDSGQLYADAPDALVCYDMIIMNQGTVSVPSAVCAVDATDITVMDTGTFTTSGYIYIITYDFAETASIHGVLLQWVDPADIRAIVYGTMAADTNDAFALATSITFADGASLIINPEGTVDWSGLTANEITYNKEASIVVEGTLVLPDDTDTDTVFEYLTGDGVVEIGGTLYTTVGKLDFTDPNAIPEGTAFYWDSDANTLTISHDLTIVSDDHGIILPDSTTLLLENNATLTVTSLSSDIDFASAIYATGDLTVLGTGHLNLFSYDYGGTGICAEGNLSLAHIGDINIYAENSDGLYSYRGTITVSNTGNLFFDGGGFGIFAHDDVVVEPSGTVYISSKDSYAIFSDYEAVTIQNTGDVTLYSGGGTGVFAYTDVTLNSIQGNVSISSLNVYNHLEGIRAECGSIAIKTDGDITITAVSTAYDLYAAEAILVTKGNFAQTPSANLAITIAGEDLFATVVPSLTIMDYSPPILYGLTVNGTAQSLEGSWSYSDGTTEYTDLETLKDALFAITDTDQVVLYYTFTPDSASYAPIMGTLSVSYQKMVFTHTGAMVAMATTPTYGDTLDTIFTFTDAEATAMVGTEEIIGTYTLYVDDLAYVNTTVLDAGTHSYYVTFSSADEVYESVSVIATTEFTVAKATNTVTFTDPTASFDYGTAITFTATPTSGTPSYLYKGADEADSTYSEIAPTSVGSYTVKAYVDASTNYDLGSATYDFVIVSAEYPYDITWPTASAITYGDSLSASTLSGGNEDGAFAWVDDSQNPSVTNGGYEVTFTPENSNYTPITSIVAVVVAKADQDAPTQVTGSYAVSTTDTDSFTYTITPIEGAEYSMDDSSWQPSNIFDGLTPEGDYIFYARMSTLDNYGPSDSANTGTITLDKLTTEEIPTLSYTITGNEGDRTVTIGAVEEAEYSFDGGTTWDASGTQTAVTAIAIDLAIRYAATATYLASDAVIVTNIDLTKESQTITLDTIGSKTYGDESFLLSSSGYDGTGSLTYTSSDETIVSIDGTTATILKAGTVTITVAIAEDEIYASATASEIVTIAEATVTSSTTPSTSGSSTASSDNGAETTSAPDSQITMEITTLVTEEGESSTTTIVAVIADDTTSVVIPQETLTTIANQETAILTIQTEEVVLELDATATSTVTNAVMDSNHEEIVISASMVDSSIVPAESIADLDNIVMLDLTITVDGNPVSYFNGGTVKVTIPYTKVNENTLVVVYYVADDGTLTKMDSVYDVEKGSLSFSTTHFSYYLASEQAPLPFTDVAEDSYYYDGVRWAVNLGITEGTSETAFEPDTLCSRAQAITLLWRAMGCPVASIENPFTDLEEGSYYYDAVLWAVEMGITEGTTDLTFEPYAPCTRGQIITFLWRMDGEEASEGDPFNDVEIDAYYYAPVAWALSQSITTGYPDGTFQPDTFCTRSQIVTFLYRYLG